MHGDNSWRKLAPWLVVLFLTVLGAKLWVIQIYGTDIPYWDQWDEARDLFQPWLAGRLTWAGWFAPHNEHRIFFTRVLDVLGLWLNGQWDPRLQAVASAILHAGFACGLAGCLWFFTGRKSAALAAVLLVPLFALPFAAENTIHGFQSQMYFVDMFSLAAMLGLAFGRVGSGWWWVGLAAAVAAIFTMGSGFLAAAAVLSLMFLRALEARRITRQEALAAGAALAVVALGLALNSAPASHKQFHARSIGLFLEALGANLAWPFSNQPWLIPVLWLPLVILGVAWFRGRIQNRRGVELVLLLAIWGLLQAAALAFGRARLAGSIRYLDTLSLLLLPNLASLMVLRESPGWSRWSAPMRSFLAIAWSGLLLLGLWQCSQSTLTDYLVWSRSTGLVAEKNLRAFVTADAANSATNQLSQDVLYHTPKALEGLLRDTHLLSILPPTCRRPLKLVSAEPEEGGFIRPGNAPELPPPPATATWGSFTTNGARETGRFLSQPMQARLPQLMLPVGCGDSLAGLRLRLIETNGQSTELALKVAGRWETLIFAAPAGPFQLEISDTNPASWIAVGEMTEAGTLTVAAGRLTQLAVPMLLAGLLGYGLLAAWRWRQAPGAFSERLILPVMILAFAGVWRARDFDGDGLASQLERALAKTAASQGDGAGAQAHWRDALYFRPDNPEALGALADFTRTNAALAPAEAARLAAAYERAARKQAREPARPGPSLP